MKSFVWGIGTSQFGRQPEKSAAQLVWEAVTEAVADADADPRSFDAIYIGSCFGEPGVAPRALAGLGLTGTPIYSMESACASSSSAFHEAHHAVRTGRYGTVLVIGVDHLSSRFTGAIEVEQRDIEGRSGLALPALYAMSATRYQEVYGLKPEVMAGVSVKNRRHGVHNERAQFVGEVSLDEVLASRMIAEPLTLLQCCPVTDAAAAVVVGSRRRNKHDITVRGSAMSSGHLWGAGSEHVWGFDLARRVANEAYELTGIGPSDIDFFELHDAFTIGEIVTTEAIGLAELGEGGCLIETGHTAVGGKQPVNPSGGLLSRGHPLGATGIAQIAEAVWQLRGHAGARQVDGAGIGMVETLGGGVAGIDGNACVVSILTN